MISLKIDSTGIQRVLGAYNASKPAAVKKNGQTSQKDELSLSQAAQTFQMALKAANESVEMRLEKVDAVKALYDAGKYHVDSAKVAESIILHALGKK